MVYLQKIIFLLIIVSGLQAIAQTDEIKFNNKLDKLSFNSSSPAHIVRLMGHKPDSTDKGRGWVTRTDGCYRFESEILNYKKEGLTFYFKKLRKPAFIPLISRSHTLKKITIDASSGYAINNFIKINSSKIEDVKNLFGAPTESRIDESDKITTQEYGYYDIIFDFDPSGILFQIEMFSKHIDRDNKPGF